MRLAWLFSPLLLGACYDVDSLRGMLDAMTGPADLAGVDGAHATSSCSSSAVALCEGFESGSYGAVWHVTQTRASVSVERGNTARGDFALHVRTNAVAQGTDTEIILHQQDVLPANDDSFARVFFYAPSALPGRAIMVFSDQDNAPYEGYTVGTEDGTFGVQSLVSGDYELHPSMTPLPVGRWSCLELQITSRTNATGGYHLWLDDAQILEVTNVATQPSPGVGQLGFGLYYYNPNAALPALDLWIDEIAIDHQRIGCGK